MPKAKVVQPTTPPVSVIELPEDKRKVEDELILEARRLGLDDALAAEYAGIPPEILQQRILKDPSLRGALRRAFVSLSFL